MSSMSIVVPRLGTNDLFENTLASVLRYRMPHHQVVVVQSDLQADTYGLEDEVDFIEVPGKQKLARYLNQAIPELESDVVNVLRPGIEVTHHWFAQAMRYLLNPANGSVACSLVASDNRDDVVSRGLQHTRSMLPEHVVAPLLRPTGPSAWAAFYRHDVLQSIGSLDESISDEFVALDIALGMRTMGLKCEVVDDRVLTIADEDLLKVSSRHQTGCDAHRMVQRHMSRDEQRIGSAMAWSSEILSSFWRPTRWAQVAGRFTARNKQATDRAFGRRMALAKHELIEKTVPQKKAA